MKCTLPFVRHFQLVLATAMVQAVSDPAQAALTDGEHTGHEGASRRLDVKFVSASSRDA